MDDLSHLTLFPARLVLNREEQIPDDSGIYFFFFRGGHRLLSVASYYDLGGARPLTFKRRQHLYTGASYNLRDRLRQHVRGSIATSSLRLSLLTLEKQARALSRTDTPRSNVKCEASLTEWLSANALIGFEVCADPLQREKQILSEFVSPLNIVHRRTLRYSRELSAWRQQCFPCHYVRNSKRLNKK